MEYWRETLDGERTAYNSDVYKESRSWRLEEPSNGTTASIPLQRCRLKSAVNFLRSEICKGKGGELEEDSIPQVEQESGNLGGIGAVMAAEVKRAKSTSGKVGVELGREKAGRLFRMDKNRESGADKGKEAYLPHVGADNSEGPGKLKLLNWKKNQELNTGRKRHDKNSYARKKRMLYRLHKGILDQSEQGLHLRNATLRKKRGKERERLGLTGSSEEPRYKTNILKCRKS